MIDDTVTVSVTVNGDGSISAMDVRVPVVVYNPTSDWYEVGGDFAIVYQGDPSGLWFVEYGDTVKTCGDLHFALQRAIKACREGEE